MKGGVIIIWQIKKNEADGVGSATKKGTRKLVDKVEELEAEIGAPQAALIANQVIANKQKAVGKP